MSGPVVFLDTRNSRPLPGIQITARVDENVAVVVDVVAVTVTTNLHLITTLLVVPHCSCGLMAGLAVLP